MNLCMSFRALTEIKCLGDFFVSQKFELLTLYSKQRSECEPGFVSTGESRETPVLRRHDSLVLREPGVMAPSAMLLLTGPQDAPVMSPRKLGTSFPPSKHSVV